VENWPRNRTHICWLVCLCNDGVTAAEDYGVQRTGVEDRCVLSTDAITEVHKPKFELGTFGSDVCFGRLGTRKRSELQLLSIGTNCTALMILLFRL
jgi:hypothetical protein